MNPIISIIVPIYNVENYLPKCLDSLINQTFSQEYEIICVNDGSPDNCQAIIEKYQSQYPHVIKGVIKPNGGLADARNFGLKVAQGKFVLFIDSDDWISHTMLENMYNKAIILEADVVVCDMEYVYEDGEIKFISGGNFNTTNILSSPEIIKINNSACNKLFNAHLFNEIEFPKGLWYEDLGCVPIVLAKAKKIVKLDEVHYYYLQRKGSIMNTPSPKIFDIYKALEIIKNGVATLDKRLECVVESMFIEHGVKLTTQRIREYETDREIFLKKNIELMKSYYPHWIRNKCISKYSVKERILFYLLYLKQYKLVIKLYDRK